MRITSVNSSFMKLVLAASPEQIAAGLAKTFPNLDPQMAQRISSQFTGYPAAEWVAKQVLGGSPVEDCIQALKAFLPKQQILKQMGDKAVGFAGLDLRGVQEAVARAEAVDPAALQQRVEQKKVQKQEQTFESLRNIKNPNLQQGDVSYVWNEMQNVPQTRWVLERIDASHPMDLLIEKLREYIDNRDSLVQMKDKDIDFTRLSYDQLVAAIARAETAPGSFNQFKKKLGLPETAEKALAYISNKLANSKVKFDKEDVYRWGAHIFNSEVERILRSGTKKERIEHLFEVETRAVHEGKDAPAAAYSPQTDPAAVQRARTESGKRIQEDRKPLSSGLHDYFYYKEKTGNVPPLSTFNSKKDLIDWVNSKLTPQEKDIKYTLDPQVIANASSIPGVERLKIGGLDILKITKWSKTFAESLVKLAYWCVADERAFKSYKISPDNPLYMVLSGNRQLALVGLSDNAGWQAKDPDDNAISAATGKMIAPAMLELSKATGGIQFKDDCTALLASDEAANEAVRQVRENIAAAGRGDSVAVFEKVKEVLETAAGMKKYNGEAKAGEVTALAMRALSIGFTTMKHEIKTQGRTTTSAKSLAYMIQQRKQEVDWFVTAGYFGSNERSEINKEAVQASFDFMDRISPPLLAGEVPEDAVERLYGKGDHNADSFSASILKQYDGVKELNTIVSRSGGWAENKQFTPRIKAFTDGVMKSTDSYYKKALAAVDAQIGKDDTGAYMAAERAINNIKRITERLKENQFSAMFGTLRAKAIEAQKNVVNDILGGRYDAKSLFVGYQTPDYGSREQIDETLLKDKARLLHVLNEASDRDAGNVMNGHLLDREIIEEPEMQQVVMGHLKRSKDPRGTLAQMPILREPTGEASISQAAGIERIKMVQTFLDRLRHEAPEKAQALLDSAPDGEVAPGIPLYRIGQATFYVVDGKPLATQVDDQVIWDMEHCRKESTKYYEEEPDKAAILAQKARTLAAEEAKRHTAVAKTDAKRWVLKNCRLG